MGGGPLMTCIDDLDGRLFRPRLAAEYLGLSEKFLRTRRHTGDGPRYVRIAPNCVRYRVADLDRWIDERVASHTAEETLDAFPRSHTAT